MLDYLVMNYKASPQVQTEQGTVSVFRRQFDGYEIAINIQSGLADLVSATVYLDEDGDAKFLKPNLNFLLRDVNFSSIEKQVAQIIPILKAMKIKG